jgi:hypothetical protein
MTVLSRFSLTEDLRVCLQASSLAESIVGVDVDYESMFVGLGVAEKDVDLSATKNVGVDDVAQLGWKT